MKLWHWYAVLTVLSGVVGFMLGAGFGFLGHPFIGWAVAFVVGFLIGAGGTWWRIRRALCGGMAVRNWVRWWRQSRTNDQGRGAGHGPDVR